MNIDPRLLISMDRKDETTIFTVDDPFADCLYVKPTLDEANRDQESRSAPSGLPLLQKRK